MERLKQSPKALLSSSVRGLEGALCYEGVVDRGLVLPGSAVGYRVLAYMVRLLLCFVEPFAAAFSAHSVEAVKLTSSLGDQTTMPLTGLEMQA